MDIPIFPNEIAYLIGLEADIFTLATLRQSCSSYHQLFSKVAKERYPSRVFLIVYVNRVTKRFTCCIYEKTRYIAELFLEASDVPVYRKTQHGFDYYQKDSLTYLTRTKYLIRESEWYQYLGDRDYYYPGGDLIIREELLVSHVGTNIKTRCTLELRVTRDDFIPLQLHVSDEYRHMLVTWDQYRNHLWEMREKPRTSTFNTWNYDSLSYSDCRVSN